jgi:hypothetical protein
VRLDHEVLRTNKGLKVAISDNEIAQECAKCDIVAMHAQWRFNKHRQLVAAQRVCIPCFEQLHRDADAADREEGAEGPPCMPTPASRGGTADAGLFAHRHRLTVAQHRGSAAKRDSMKKRPPWTPTYKISALRQLHPLVGRRPRLRDCYATAMQYVVLLRYGLRRLYPVLRVLRTDSGEIRCAEVRVPCAGMTWHPDGRFRLTDRSGRPHDSMRRTLASINEPLVAYSMSGPELLDDALQPYDSTLDVGATVQVSAHAVLEEPTRVALQLVLVKRGDEPYHRETVGDRRIDDGQPDIWIVLARCDDGPPGRVAAAQPVLRWPPLRTEAKS